jgi:Uma2 family endonuclease
MSDPARRAATYQDLLAVDDTKVAEIVAGDLVVSPRPASMHTHAASALGAELWGAFQRGRGGPGGWWILFEPELHLGADVVVPDLAGWKRTRMPDFPDVPFFGLAPDWVCEIVSPATQRLDRVRKLPLYAREGVAHAWLVDPVARSLEVFRCNHGQWLLIAAHAEDERVQAEPFHDLVLDLAVLWPPARRDP